MCPSQNRTRTHYRWYCCPYYSTHPRSMESSPRHPRKSTLTEVSIQPEESGRDSNRNGPCSPKKNFQLWYMSLAKHLKMNVFLRTTRAQQKIQPSFQLTCLTETPAKSRLPPTPQDPLKYSVNTLQKNVYLFWVCSDLQVRLFCNYSLVKTITTLLMKIHPQFHKNQEIPIDPEEHRL